MSFWKKIKKGVQQSTEKAVDFVDEGLEKLKPSEVNAADLGRHQNDVAELRKNADHLLKELGGYILDSCRDGVDENLLIDLEPKIQDLKGVQSDLATSEAELKAIYSTYQKQSVSMAKLKTFKEELEMAGCAIENFIVADNSPYIGLALSEIDLPEDLLLGLIIREGQAIIPAGTTEIKPQDKIMLMGKKEAVVSTLYQFNPKTEQV